jgi:uncharacterized FlaG/YvyC family protein
MSRDSSEERPTVNDKRQAIIEAQRLVIEHQDRIIEQLDRRIETLALHLNKQIDDHIEPPLMPASPTSTGRWIGRCG